MQQPEPGSLPSHWSAYLAPAARHNHVLVDRAAAWLHGIDAYAWAEHDVPLVPESCVIGTRRATRRADVDGCRRALAPADWAHFDGVAATTPLRTALDLGCVLRRWHAYAALNEFARVHRLPAAALAAGAARYRRRRGVVQLRELLQIVEPRVESAGESRVLLSIHDANLPLPTPQHHVSCATGETFRLDFAYALRRLAVEYDGREFHTSGHHAARDTWRRDLLRQEGWRLIVITAEDFHGDHQDAWIRRLREELAVDVTNRRW